MSYDRYCMRHHPLSRPCQTGFTLLELLVVMSLVGLMSGLIAPRLWSWVISARERAGLDALHSALTALPVRTFFSGQAKLIAKAHDADLPLLDGWRLELQPALHYESNGMTGGGQVKVWHDKQLLADWQVLAPSGRVVAAADEGPEQPGER